MPEVHGKADIAGPEGIPTSAQLIARLAALGYGGCGECPGAFEPHRIACSPMEFEKRISVAAGAMTEIGTLSERTCFPSQLATAVPWASARICGEHDPTNPRVALADGGSAGADC